MVRPTPVCCHVVNCGNVQMMNSDADDRGAGDGPMCHHLLVLYFTNITSYKIDRFLMPGVVQYLSACQDVAANINIAWSSETSGDYNVNICRHGARGGLR